MDERGTPSTGTGSQKSEINELKDDSHRPDVTQERPEITRESQDVTKNGSEVKQNGRDVTGNDHEAVQDGGKNSVTEGGESVRLTDQNDTPCESSEFVLEVKTSHPVELRSSVAEHEDEQAEVLEKNTKITTHENDIAQIEAQSSTVQSEVAKMETEVVKSEQKSFVSPVSDRKNEPESNTSLGIKGDFLDTQSNRYVDNKDSTVRDIQGDSALWRATRPHCSGINDSDSEVSEILCNADPPSVLPEEEEEPQLQESLAGMETIIIMKKTFTESIKPYHEFIPISNDFSFAFADQTNPETTSSTGPKQLEKHTNGKFAQSLVVSSTGASQMECLEKKSEGGKVLQEVKNGEAEENILSKAHIEARDLTSEFRRLQYLLENLSAFTESELALLRPSSTTASEDVTNHLEKPGKTEGNDTDLKTKPETTNEVTESLPTTTEEAQDQTETTTEDCGC